MSEVERVTAPTYCSGLADRSLDELRSMRAECQDIENALSYARRLAHGRIDIVAAETARRLEGVDPASLASIIDRLPDVLSDGPRQDALPRPPLDIYPASELADDLVAAIDRDLPSGGVSALPELTDDEVAVLSARLYECEHELSRDRRRLHEVIDLLHAEIIRRYQSGEATVESLLR